MPNVTFPYYLSAQYGSEQRLSSSVFPVGSSFLINTFNTDWKIDEFEKPAQDILSSIMPGVDIGGRGPVRFVSGDELSSNAEELGNAGLIDALVPCCAPSLRLR